MEIVYKREHNRSYMVIQRTEETVYQDYQIEMLKRNKIDGLLPLSVRQRDDLVDLYYDISSKQPLGRFFESRKLSRYEVEKLILGIFATMENLKPYLLKEEQISLLPEYIYIDPGNLKVHLCLIPGDNRDFIEDLKKLLHKFMDFVDYQDKEGVELVYYLYHQVLQDNFQIRDLLKGFSEKNNGSSIQWQTSDQPERMLTKGESEDVSLLGQDEVLSYFPEAHPSEITQVLRDRGILGNLKKFFFPKKLNQEEDNDSEITNQDFQYSSNYENTIEPLSYVKEGHSEDTVLLENYQKDRKQIVMLKSISPLAYEDILINTFPFIIGKGQKGVHYSIDHPAVSRFHISISKTKDGFQAEDLNSTNGTRIDGRLLIANEKRALSHGSLVEIAGMEFYFYNHHQI